MTTYDNYAEARKALQQESPRQLPLVRVSWNLQKASGPGGWRARYDDQGFEIGEAIIHGADTVNGKGGNVDI